MLSRAIADSGHAGVLAKLADKCSWYGADYALGRPVVSILKVVRSLWLAQRRDGIVGSPMVVSRLWRVSRP